jgi:hypothetical protein
MALHKTIKNPSGVESNYWRIVESTVRFEEKTIRILVYGYLSAHFRNENPENPSHTLTILATPNEGFKSLDSYVQLDPDFDINSVLKSELYDMVRDDPRFEGSTDV